MSENRCWDDLTDQAKLGLDDLFVFGNYYWGLQLEEKPHRWICDEIMATSSMAETPHLILDVPRGCYKTSIVTADAVRQYLRHIFLYDNPYHRIVYGSNTLKLGKGFLRLIENILRAGGCEGRINEDYRPLWKFPDRIERKSSRQDDGLVLLPRFERGEIASVKEPNFFIASIGALPIGYHADGAILDDLNNKKNVSTPEQLLKTHEFYHQIYPIIHTVDRVGNPAHIYMPCTPWHDNDVRGMIMREEEERRVEDPEYVSPWRVVKAKAISDEGELFFPSKLTHKALEGLKRGMGTEFDAAYMGEPVAPGAAIAEKEQIRWRPRDSFPALRWCRISVDPNQHSEAKALGCHAAIAMGGYDQFAKLWVWDVRGSREWDTGRLISELYSLQGEHPAWPIFIEDEHMRHFEHAVNLEFVIRMQRWEKEGGDQPQRLRINYVPAPRNLSKYERWENSLKPRFQSASIFFAQEMAPSIKQEVENELLRGKAARFKDYLDALSMLETGVIPRYKADGAGEVLQGPKDMAGAEHRALTWSDAIGEGIFQ